MRAAARRGGESFWPAFGLLVLADGCMYAPYGPYFALIPELVHASLRTQQPAAAN